jgi:hypothetical protein
MDLRRFGRFQRAVQSGSRRFPERAEHRQFTVEYDEPLQRAAARFVAPTVLLLAGLQVRMSRLPQ